MPHHANVLWNGYLNETADLDGLPLMPLFLSCRAAVMAKTMATTANLQNEADCRAELQALANEYLTMAEALLQPATAASGRRRWPLGIGQVDTGHGPGAIHRCGSRCGGDS